MMSFLLTFKEHTIRTDETFNYLNVFYQADLEGIPEITANITSSTLDFLVVHPCVLEGDTHVQIPSFQPSQMLKGPELVGRKVRFRPPTESFPLCHYSAKAPSTLPIQGIYQMQVTKICYCQLARLNQNKCGLKHHLAHFERQSSLQRLLVLSLNQLFLNLSLSGRQHCPAKSMIVQWTTFQIKQFLLSWTCLKKLRREVITPYKGGYMVEVQLDFFLSFRICTFLF